MWKQVEGFKSAIYPVLRNAAQGVHFICYSQGLNVLNIWFICYLFCHFSIRLTCTVNNNTLFFVFLAGGLVCRGILSTLPDHNVQTFISLSSPQAGQYGGKWDFWSNDFYTETCLNPSWCLCLFLLPRHRLFEVPLPSLLQVQPLPYLLHCFWSDDLHLQLLEWWEFWNIFVSVLWPCVDGKLNSANRKKKIRKHLLLLTPCFGFPSCLPPDPHHRDRYVNSSEYLALLNSERPNPNSTGW